MLTRKRNSKQTKKGIFLFFNLRGGTSLIWISNELSQVRRPAPVGERNSKQTKEGYFYFLICLTARHLFGLVTNYHRSGDLRQMLIPKEFFVPLRALGGLV